MTDSWADWWKDDKTKPMTILVQEIQDLETKAGRMMGIAREKRLKVNIRVFGDHEA